MSKRISLLQQIKESKKVRSFQTLVTVDVLRPVGRNLVKDGGDGEEEMSA